MEYKIDLKIMHHGGHVMGPGTARLLGLVRTTSSLHRAATEMQMSYSKAWGLVKATESALGFPLMIRSRGGSQGGGSTLTPEAERLLDAYQAFCRAMQAEGDRLFAEHFAPFTDKTTEDDATDA